LLRAQGIWEMSGLIIIRPRSILIQFVPVCVPVPEVGYAHAHGHEKTLLIVPLSSELPSGCPRTVSMGLVAL
jgi:hypothetical protein